MLLGQYESKVGEKSRTALPKKLREEIGEKLIITLGYENSLIIVSESGWKALLEGTEGRPFIENPPERLNVTFLEEQASLSLILREGLLYQSTCDALQRLKQKLYS